MGERGVLGKRSPGKQRLHQRKAAGPCTHFLLGGLGRITLTAEVVLVRPRHGRNTGSVSEKGAAAGVTPTPKEGQRWCSRASCSGTDMGSRPSSTPSVLWHWRKS